MKSNIAKMATVLIVGVASFNAAVAADAPACPRIGNGKAPAELNDVFRNPAGGGWVVASQPIDKRWGSLFVTVFDTDVYDEKMAFERGRQILASIAMPPMRAEAVELKEYNTDGSYYYVCYYPISVSYVGFGDYLGTVSEDYPPDHGVSEAKIKAHRGFDKFVRAR